LKTICAHLQSAYLVSKSINLVGLSLSLCNGYLSRSEQEGGERQQTQQEQVEGRHRKQSTSSLKSKQKKCFTIL
jgi:hypothetical protein